MGFNRVSGSNDKAQSGSARAHPCRQLVMSFFEAMAWEVPGFEGALQPTKAGGPWECPLCSKWYEDLTDSFNKPGRGVRCCVIYGVTEFIDAKGREFGLDRTGLSFRDGVRHIQGVLIALLDARAEGLSEVANVIDSYVAVHRGDLL